MMEHLGWRTAWMLNAGLVIAGVAAALIFLPRQGDKPIRSRKEKVSEDAGPSKALWRDPRILLTLPAILAGPLS